VLVFAGESGSNRTTRRFSRRNKNEVAVKTRVVSPSYSGTHGANVNVVTALEGDLEIALLDLYQKWKQIRHYDVRFKEMVTKTKHRIGFYKGPVATVRHLLLGKPSNTFRVLVERGRIDWTVEWLITADRKWKPLLTDRMIQKAKARIKAALATNTGDSRGYVVFHPLSYRQIVIRKSLGESATMTASYCQDRAAKVIPRKRKAPPNH